MRILAIETSGRHGSVAALEGEGGAAQLIRQTDLAGEQRTAQALAPAMRKLLAEVTWSPKQAELVAVAVGPGSFTGLRIGVTTAKTFAYAVGAQVIGVNTLVAMAEQAPPQAGRLWTILDAQRQELFVAKFEGDNRARTEIGCDTTILSQGAWLAGLRKGDRVTGPALRRLVNEIPDGVQVVPEEDWQPMAAAVGRVAWRAYHAGQRDDLWKLAPQYYRPSYAEEKAARGVERGARSE